MSKIPHDTRDQAVDTATADGASGKAAAPPAPHPESPELPHQVELRDAARGRHVEECMAPLRAQERAPQSARAANVEPDLAAHAPRVAAKSDPRKFLQGPVPPCSTMRPPVRRVRNEPAPTVLAPAAATTSMTSESVRQQARPTEDIAAPADSAVPRPAQEPVTSDAVLSALEKLAVLAARLPASLAPAFEDVRISKPEGGGYEYCLMPTPENEAKYEELKAEFVTMSYADKVATFMTMPADTPANAELLRRRQAEEDRASKARAEQFARDNTRRFVHDGKVYEVQAGQSVMTGTYGHEWTTSQFRSDWDRMSSAQLYEFYRWARGYLFKCIGPVPVSEALAVASSTADVPAAPVAVPAALPTTNKRSGAK